MHKNTQEVKLGEYRQPLAKQLMLYQIQNDITFICIFVFFTQIIKLSENHETHNKHIK